MARPDRIEMEARTLNAALDTVLARPDERQARMVDYYARLGFDTFRMFKDPPHVTGHVAADRALSAVQIIRETLEGFRVQFSDGTSATLAATVHYHLQSIERIVVSSAEAALREAQTGRFVFGIVDDNGVVGQ